MKHQDCPSTAEKTPLNEIITYSLRAGAKNSNEYYRDIKAFADTWTGLAAETMGDVIQGFSEYRMAKGLPQRTVPEYLLELLALGIYLDEHARQRPVPKWLAATMAGLIDMGERQAQVKQIVKHVRGFINGLIQAQAQVPVHPVSVEDMLSRLQAQGESGIARRLAEWQGYLESLDSQTKEKILARCHVLAEQFDLECTHSFGRYTKGVQTFLEQTAPTYRWSYDSAFVSRPRREYHLGMLATEILNRSFRDRFLQTQRKVVIVPPCMRVQPDEDCQAVPTPMGEQCQGCKPNCRVHQITKLGQKHGFDVFIIPDELRGIGSEAGATAGGLGLVGISCILTNWSGGWDADNLGIPAQGLPLDYVGCRYHWHESGISTDTNLQELQHILDLR